MKRSEMVKLIDQEIFNRKCMDEDILGHDILTVIEKALFYWEPEDD